jgi:predicted CxxxxCH...CXXCH cytochrome family protein
MSGRRLSLLATLAVALLASCSASRTTSPGSQACTSCHGGALNNSGAPPADLHGNQDVNSYGVGAHTAHVASGVACESCHQVPQFLGDPNVATHLDGTVEVVFSALARQGATTAPSYRRTPGTCAVYCHGGTLGLGGTNHAPKWVGNGPLDCNSCHASPPSIAPHSAGMTLQSCTTCHPTTVDAAGHIVPGGTHVNGVPDATISGCTGCHGSAGRTEAIALNQAAPPLDVAGHTASAQVGAHQAHLHDSVLAKAFACAECHQDPGHAGHTTPVGDAKVQFTGTLASAGGATPGFAGGTCSNVYCHGATLPGGTRKTPSWSAGPAAVGLGGALSAACNSCHGFPPPSPHPALTSPAILDCRPCHQGTINVDGSINLAAHVDGTVEGGAPHPVPYPPAQHGPAAKAGLTGCTQCHGADFGTIVNVANNTSCNTCHAANGHPKWQTECTFCHGDPARAEAPAFDLVGDTAVRANKAGPPLSATGLSAFAHQRHYSNDPVAGNLLSSPIVCNECHGTLPQDVGHVDGTVPLTFGTLATTGGITASPQVSVTVGDGTVSCANYCHGKTILGGSNKTPTWGGTNQAACGTCHGLPPTYAAPSYHVTRTDCATCHAGYTASTVAVATHVNGAVDVSVSCGTCHTVAAANPFVATDGQTATSDNRVGAHAIHTKTTSVTNAFACTVCHGALPGATQHANGHVDIAWGSPANAGGVTPTPAGPITVNSAVTCANYCHGATLSGGNSPTWTGGAMACNGCHFDRNSANLPGGHGVTSEHMSNGCQSCHYATARASGATDVINTKANHLNGTIDFQFDPAVGMTFTKTASGYTCTGTCHGGGSIGPVSSW